MAAERTKGFSHVVVTSNQRDGFSLLIQSAGLGGMKHNTVLMAWPAGRTRDRDPASLRNFIGKSGAPGRPSSPSAWTGTRVTGVWSP